MTATARGGLSGYAEGSGKNTATTAVLLFVILGCLIGCGDAQSDSLTTVRQGGFKVIHMAVPFVAKEKGFFERNGLDWRYIPLQSGKLGAAALLSGNVEFVDLSLDDIVNLQEAGRDPILIFNVVNSLAMNLVIRDDVLERAGVGPRSPLPEKLKALEGLTFGITQPGAGSHIYLSYLLRKVDLAPDRDATFVQIGSPQAMVLATHAGRVDGFLLSPPWPNLVASQGAGTILLDNAGGEGPEEFRDFAFHSVATLRSYADANPETVESYACSLKEAFEWMQANKEEALRLLQKYFPDTDAEVLATSYDAIVPAMNSSGWISSNAISSQLEVLQEAGVISSPPSPEEGVLWTNQYNRASSCRQPDGQGH